MKLMEGGHQLQDKLGAKVFGKGGGLTGSQGMRLNTARSGNRAHCITCSIYCMFQCLSPQLTLVSGGVMPPPPMPLPCGPWRSLISVPCPLQPLAPPCYTCPPPSTTLSCGPWRSLSSGGEAVSCSGPTRPWRI